MKMKKEIVSQDTLNRLSDALLMPYRSLFDTVKGKLYLSEWNTESSPCLCVGVKPWLCLSEGLKPCLCLSEGDYTPHFENCSALKKDLPPYSTPTHAKLFLTKIFSQSLVNQINNVTQTPLSRLKWSFVRRENRLFMPLFDHKILNFWDKNLNFYFTFKHITN